MRRPVKYRLIAVARPSTWNDMTRAKQAEEELTSVLNALKKVGFNLEFDEEKISQLFDLQAELDDSGKKTRKGEIEDGIWNSEELSLRGKTMASEFAGILVMSECDFARQLETRKKFRAFLLSFLKKEKASLHATKP
jgi:hypothetical protein